VLCQPLLALYRTQGLGQSLIFLVRTASRSRGIAIAFLPAAQ